MASGCLIPRLEHHEYRDRGDACLIHANADAVSAELQPGDDLEIVVFFPHGCLSSSCSDVRITTCEATLTGNEIHVSSHGVVEEDVSANACTTDCGIMTARCNIDLDEPGDYTIVHGDQTTPITLPGEPECAGGL